MTQNLNSRHFQPFVLYTAAAVIYVVAAFVIDFLFRGDRAACSPRRRRDGLAGFVDGAGGGAASRRSSSASKLSLA